VSKPIKTSPLFSHLHNGPLASGGGKDSYRRSIHTPVTFPDRNVSDREEASLEPASSRPIRADFSWSEQISRIRTSPKRKCDASALSVGRFYEPNRWSVTIFLFVFVDSRDLWFLRHTCDAIMLPLLHGKKSPKSSVCLHRNNSFWSAYWYSNQEHGSQYVLKTSFR